MFRAAFQLSGALALASVALAVILGHAAPEPAEARFPAPPRYSSIQGAFCPRHATRLLDCSTGAVLDNPVVGPGLVIEYPTCSSWKDAQGRWQLIALWKDRGPPIGSAGVRGFGLARYSAPDGRLLDRISCWPVPASVPCWLPGTAARIVFAASDGGLYRFDFERPDGTPAVVDGDDPNPRPLGWLCPRPGRAPGRFGDISRPDGLPHGPWIVATQSCVGAGSDPADPSANPLCWLRLSPDGEAVIAAGRLTRGVSDGPTAGPAVLHHPRLATAPEGGLTLAYLVKRGMSETWSLQVAPVVLDPCTLVPAVAEAGPRTLAEGALLNPPAFSPDGRWVYAALGTEGAGTRLVRFANPFAGRPPGGREGPLAPGRRDTRTCSFPTRFR